MSKWCNGLFRNDGTGHSVSEEETLHESHQVHEGNGESGPFSVTTRRCSRHHAELQKIQEKWGREDDDSVPRIPVAALHGLQRILGILDAMKASDLLQVEPDPESPLASGRAHEMGSAVNWIDVVVKRYKSRIPKT